MTMRSRQNRSDAVRPGEPAEESAKRRPSKKPVEIRRAKRGAGATVENVVANKRASTSYAAQHRSARGFEANQQKRAQRVPQPRKK